LVIAILFRPNIIAFVCWKHWYYTSIYKLSSCKGNEGASERHEKSTL